MIVLVLSHQSICGYHIYDSRNHHHKSVRKIDRTGPYRSIFNFSFSVFLSRYRV